MKSTTELPWTAPEAGASVPLRRGSRVAKTALYVIVPLLLIVSLFRLPGHSGCLGHKPRPTKPTSIEERVDHILSRTPLIGSLPH